MTEPKQDVTISAGPSKNINVNPNALNVLANLSSGVRGGIGAVDNVGSDDNDIQKNMVEKEKDVNNDSLSHSSGHAIASGSSTLKRKLNRLEGLVKHREATKKIMTEHLVKTKVDEQVKNEDAADAVAHDRSAAEDGQQAGNETAASESSSLMATTTTTTSPAGIVATKSPADLSTSALSRLLSRGVTDQDPVAPNSNSDASVTPATVKAPVSGTAHLVVGTEILERPTTASAAAGFKGTLEDSGLAPTRDIRELLQRLPSSTTAAAVSAGTTPALDSYLQQRLTGGLGGMISSNPTPSLASIIAARRSQMLPNHLGLIQQMEEYERTFPLSAAAAAATVGLGELGRGYTPTGLVGASSLLQSRLAGHPGSIDSVLGLGGHSLLGTLGASIGAPGGLGSVPGLMTTDSSHLLGRAATSQAFRSSSLLSGLTAAERLEALGIRRPAIGETQIGTDRLSALALTAAGAAASLPTEPTVAASAESKIAAISKVDPSTTNRGLGPARGVFHPSIKTGNEGDDATYTKDGQIYQRFRGYQCEQWTDKYNDLLKFKAEKGHCQVPHAYTENVGLARWVKRQRYQYKLMMDKKQSTMTPERVKLLEEIGFIWDSHASTWEERLNELKQYAAVHGDCNVPSSYSGNPKLATWIKCQRRQYKLLQEGRTSNMTLERMRELEKIGFNWRVQP